MDTLINAIKKFNVWDGKFPDLGYIRNLYIDKIFTYSDNNLIKVITGQRRVGKSYLLRQIIKKYTESKNINPKNIFYLNKEYLVFDQINTYKDLENLYQDYLRTIKPEGKKLIFIDEIQNIESWEKFINSYSQDLNNEYEIYISGSNSQLLSGELATYLSGRYIEFEIYPFNFFEYCDFKNQDTSKANFINYLKDSGLPELFHFDNEEVKRHYFESLINTIVLRDIVNRHKIKDSILLNNLFLYLSSNISNLVSLPGIIRYYKNQQKKVNYDTLASYLDYLNSTFLFHTAERYNIRGKTVLTGEKKYYLNDLGFKNYLLGFHAEDMGYNLENYVYLMLKSHRYKVNVGIIGKSEIDFIAQKGNEVLYIQVTYLLLSDKTIDREFNNLLKIKDNHKKIVISLDDIRFDNKDGIIHLRPWELNEYLN